MQIWGKLLRFWEFRWFRQMRCERKRTHWDQDSRHVAKLSAPGQLLRLARGHSSLFSQIVFVHEDSAIGIVDVGLDLSWSLPSVWARKD